MKFPTAFICASAEYSSLTHFVPSPYFRRAFTVCEGNAPASLLVTGLGFYRVWINGTEITKGLLAPYISNPDHYVYFDEYEISPYLVPGENVLGFQLGNGMMNAPGGTVWDFETAPFRGAPRLSFALEYEGLRITADRSVKTAPSPVYFDDLRCGTRYDARAEKPGWNAPGYDDGDWQNALPCEAPKGKFLICRAEPVRPTGKVLRPVSVTPAGTAPYEHVHPRVRGIEDPELVPKEGLLFDFGENNAGFCRLKLNGRPGQRVSMQFAEFETEGKIDYSNINFYPDGMSQRDVYICAGGEAVFEPPFTYHGFRYCLVCGLAEDQLTPDVLEYVICSSDFPAAGSFRCSDETANALYRMAENSDRANFYYFPTDCPHREKNGWTGDAALSAAHMLLTMHCEKSLAEWLRNVRAAQSAAGDLPGIVPTGGWGYGHGPSWDAVIAELPYQIYKYTGNTEVLRENADAILKYLQFAAGKRKENGLVEYGLGDWCPAGEEETAPKEYTNSVAVVKIAFAARRIFTLLGMEAQARFAETLLEEMRAAIRKKYIDPVRCIAGTGGQTFQALALAYGIFEESELPAARENLIKAVHDNGDFLKVGILGARVLFRRLTEAGAADLAYKLMTRPEYPSYAHWIEVGMTALPENFELRTDGAMNGSACHHMFGDIKGWLIEDVAGLRWKYTPAGTALLRAAPHFIEGLSFAEGTFDSPAGRISVRWAREDAGVLLRVEAPAEVPVCLTPPAGFAPDREIPAAGSFTVLLQKA